ncbi:MAG: GNAT family N-acetyltransferase [Spirulinaceae cyanobacterium RM2_2_10]|nr:GNAT family N-acetyltransferase [Spirulinaceae cyanobacterium SM2_1_0]NJO20508.1 GNAT family N-acetyltransferase [Spirulinaceae cyanobacterium RM2_2_10]
MSSASRAIEVTRTFLEMRAPQAFQPAFLDRDELILQGYQNCDLALYRWLYDQVGSRYYWYDRCDLGDERLRSLIWADNVTVWVLYEENSVAGFFELRRHAKDRSVELVYFGLRPGFCGRGLGKHLLSCAIAQAWQLPQTQRLWVHTCTLDSPAALSNYQKRGFHCFREERAMQTLPKRRT